MSHTRTGGQRRGFTLIELLVVISVIAVLMGVLIPALRAAREQGRMICCGANVRNLTMAWLMYQDDNDGQLVPVSVPIPLVSPYDPKEPNWWVKWCVKEDYRCDSEIEKEGIRGGLLYPYVKDVSAYHCPSDIRTRIAYFKEGRGREDHGIGGFRSYSIAEAAYGKSDVSGHGMVFSKKYMDIKSPSSKYIFVSGHGAYLYSSWQFNAYDETWRNFVAIWHGRDKSTLGWADGHVESHRWQDKATIELGSYNIEGMQGYEQSEQSSKDRYKYIMYKGEDIRYLTKGYPVKRLLPKPGP